MDANASVSLDELEQSNIEAALNEAGRDDISTCTCSGFCLRESGRNACPCRSVQQFCTSICHRGARSACMNCRRVLQDDDSSASEDEDLTFNEESEAESETDNDSEANRLLTRASRGRGRGGRRAWGSGRGAQRGQSGERGRGNGRARGRGRANERGRARGRGAGVARGRGRGRGRGRLEPEEDAEQRQARLDRQVQDLVHGLNEVQLRALAIELLRRQPAVYAHIANGELRVGGGPVRDPIPHANPDPGPNHSDEDTDDNHDPDPEPPNEEIPDWCNCLNCRPMPTQEENKCCSRARRPCITANPLFTQLVLDANVLDIAMRYREDVLVLEHPRNNENFRHAAYRQYVLWQHGRLGQGNRRVIPSCCVLAIRVRYPSPNGIYTGFRPARL